MTTIPDCIASFDDLSWKAYSGYLTVSDTKRLHYVYVESQDDIEHDPLVIWFNGGPGCSSLDGFFAEHGPCVIDDGETQIKWNDQSWNTRANVLYIEQPAGVGYSIAEHEQDLETNDMISSQDNLKALYSFYEKFPERLANELYVFGESYAGIYVPYLSW
jgi:cathepsin A (carboxypeptidase C)